MHNMWFVMFQIRIVQLRSYWKSSFFPPPNNYRLTEFTGLLLVTRTTVKAVAENTQLLNQGTLEEELLLLKVLLESTVSLFASIYLGLSVKTREKFKQSLVFNQYLLRVFLFYFTETNLKKQGMPMLWYFLFSSIFLYLLVLYVHKKFPEDLDLL